MATIQGESASGFFAIQSLRSRIRRLDSPLWRCSMVLPASQHWPTQNPLAPEPGSKGCC